jgi:MFS family permease
MVGPCARGWTLAAVSTALFCVQLDYFARNLALPRMAADMGNSTTNLQWVISVYMLSLGAFTVPAGRIGDIFGRRRALLTGVALFGVASVLCPVAASAGMLIAFRAVQGLGAALIFPVSVLTNAFPPNGRATQSEWLTAWRVWTTQRAHSWVVCSPKLLAGARSSG